MRKIAFGLVALLFVTGLYIWSRWLSPNGSITVDDAKRTYTVYKPGSAPDIDAPVVFVLHGNPSKSWEIQAYTGMNKVAREHGFIVVYPDALTHRWPFTLEDEVDREINYFSELLDKISRKFHVDQNRIYVCGISGGGIFSIILGNRLADRISGIGVVAGNIPRSIDRPAFMPSLPTLLIHGTGDFLYRGRDDLYSVSESVEIWTYNNKCSSTPYSTDTFDQLDGDTLAAVSIDYNCQVPFRFIRIDNGGHHWPGANFDARRFTKMKLGNFCRHVDASSEIWHFMSEIN